MNTSFSLGDVSLCSPFIRLSAPLAASYVASLPSYIPLNLTEPAVPYRSRPHVPPLHLALPTSLGPLASRLPALYHFHLSLLPPRRSLSFLSCMNLCCCNTMGSTTTYLYSTFGLTLLLGFVIHVQYIFFGDLVSYLVYLCSVHCSGVGIDRSSWVL